MSTAPLMRHLTTLTLAAALAGCASPPRPTTQDLDYCARTASILRMGDPNLNEVDYVGICLIQLGKLEVIKEQQ